MAMSPNSLSTVGSSVKSPLGGGQHRLVGLSTDSFNARFTAAD